MSGAGTSVRNTRQRTAVSALLDEVDGFHSAQDLHAMLRDRGERVGLTTVYRTLQGLADAGEVDVMRPPGGEHLYRRCSEGHHHHLVCADCGKVEPFADPGLEAALERVAGGRGYDVAAHEVVLRGACDDCRPAR